MYVGFPIAGNVESLSIKLKSTMETQIRTKLGISSGPAVKVASNFRSPNRSHHPQS